MAYIIYQFHVRYTQDLVLFLYSQYVPSIDDTRSVEDTIVEVSYEKYSYPNYPLKGAQVDDHGKVQESFAQSQCHLRHRDHNFHWPSIDGRIGLKQHNTPPICNLSAETVEGKYPRY